MAREATQLCYLHVSTCIYVFISAQYENDRVYMSTQPITNRLVLFWDVTYVAHNGSYRYLGAIKQYNICLTPEDGTDILSRNVGNIINLR
jgi:hypothetical protein